MAPTIHYTGNVIRSESAGQSPVISNASVILAANRKFLTAGNSIYLAKWSDAVLPGIGGMRRADCPCPELKTGAIAEIKLPRQNK